MEGEIRKLTVYLDTSVINFLFAEDAPEFQRATKRFFEICSARFDPRTKIMDAVHLAVCTVHGVDILLSWNFKHLANIRKQDLVNAVNAKAGYRKPLRLLNPLEVLYDDSEG
jgi:predicted nucleic acid-binding protein